MAIRYEGRVPKTLRNWIEKHAADKVVEVSHGGGFCFERGGSGYDVLLVSGYRVKDCGDWTHTVIQATVKDVIDVLKTLERCDDDDECRQAWQARAGKAVA